MKILSWLWVSILVFGVNGFAQVRVESHHEGHHHGKRPAKRAEILTAYLKENLALTPDQEQQVREILLTHGRKIAQLRRKAKEEGKRPPVEKIRSLKQAENEAIKNILNEEQLEIFISLGTDWRKKAFLWWKEKKQEDKEAEELLKEEED